MFSSSIASQMTGLPTGKPKHARGNKGSGKPFASHVGLIQKAHGAGDLHGVKVHALNLANAVTKHLKAAAPVPEPVGDDSETFPAMTQPSPQMSVNDTPAPAPASNSRAMLAKLAMSRRK